MKRVLLVLGMLTLAVGCGQDNNSSGLKIQKDLKPVLNQTMNMAPVVTINLKRADGSAIAGVDLRFRVENGNRKITVAQGTTDANGMLSLALAADTYDMKVSGAGDVADFDTSMRVSTDVTQTFTYQTEQHTFVMDAGQAIDESDLRVYQADGDGSYTRVFRDRNRNLAGAANNSVAVQLFAGNYFATATAVKTAGGDTPLVKSAEWTATAASMPSTNLDLSIAGIAIMVTLQDAAGAALANYDVWAYDKSVNLRLAQQQTDNSGVTTIRLGNATNCALLMRNGNGEIIGLKDLGNVSADASYIYNTHTVSGVVLPPTGSALSATDTANITIKLQGALANTLEQDAGATIDRNDVAMTPGTGAFSVNLLAGDFAFGAEGVEGFPSVTETAIALADLDLTDQIIHVDHGGVIHGTILDQASVAVTGVDVSILTRNSLTSTDVQWIGGAATDANGTYAIEVPYGTYDLYVDGAVTRDVKVSASAADKVVDLTRFTVTARVTDTTGAGVQADVEVLGGDQTSTDALGMYTLRVMEGINQLCFTSVMGTNCEFNVLFDDKTVANFSK